MLLDSAGAGMDEGGAVTDAVGQLDTSNLLVAALVLGCAWMGFRQLRRAMQRDDPNYAHGL